MPNFLRNLCLIFAVVPALAAQTANPVTTAPASRDWTAVRQLTPGTAISVKVRRRTNCAFREATETELTCDLYELPVPLVPGPVLLPRYPRYEPETVIFTRDSVSEVRLEHRHASVAAGVFLGTVAGAVAGAHTPTDSGVHTGNEMILGTAGAVIGGLIGRSTSFLHGKILYRR